MLRRPKRLAALVSTAAKVVRLTGASAVTAVLAYLQSRLLVQSFGAGGVLDSYYLATAIPMAAMTMLAVGGTSLLVPLLASRKNADGVRGSSKLQLLIVSAVLLALALAAAASSVLGFWPGPGFGGADVWVWLIVLGSGAYGLSLYPQAVLTAEERPSWFAWAQSFSFLVFIVLLMWLSPIPTRNAVAFLYLCGGLAQLGFAWAAMNARRAAGVAIVDSSEFLQRGRGSFFAVLAVVAAMQGIGVVDRSVRGAV